MILVIALIVIFLQTGGPTTGARKAIILCSANDFYKSEEDGDFNGSEDSEFDGETSRWVWGNQTNGYGGPDNHYPGINGTDGVLQLIATLTGYVNLEYIFNWTKFYPLFEFNAYYLSAWVNISDNAGNPTVITPPGAGVRIGLRWLNSSNDIIRTDWSKGIYDTSAQWFFLNTTAICDNSTENEITQLHLVLAVEGDMIGGDWVLFDNIRLERWFPPPIPIPPPSKTDTDGFPAQALQVYWVLKNHGYTDDNIFLMLYHKNDAIIDIYANDSISNDLTEVVIDVEDDNVTASRFKQELNISTPGSFTSDINLNDQLIIFMSDHGSNKEISGGNATFHFEADDSYISETEFYNLVKQINCKRIMINIDICFSGNFLNQNSNIGQSWYDIPNSILITSTTDDFAWFWRDNSNGDGFAGSWFFHQFWKQLNQSQTIGDAFNLASNFIPAGQVKSIFEIQSPLIQDNLGTKDVWSFTSNPPL
ncbi:unnamed protein product [marine sediment metagenome]|uniref:Uncharacterized protein n=1 Tax=marine sediment metagenome TaxID=412755 RepID=X1APF2_9ZZZZ